MKKKTILALALAVLLVLALSVSAFAREDLDAFPAAIDPQSWTVPENMTWDDWKDNPVVDWESLDLPNAHLQKGLVILVDYQDSPFIMTKPAGSDPLGNPQIQVPEEELADFWKTFLNVPSDVNHGANINAFWRENSFGNWKVEIETYGPYTLPGMEWEYGIDGMNGASAAKRAIRPEAVALFIEDMQERNTGVDLSDFTFGFVVHAGYDESGAWEEAGRMIYASPEDIPDEAGPTFAELEAIKEWGAAPAGNSEPITMIGWGGRPYVANDITWAKNLFAGVSEEGEYLIDYTDEDEDGYPDKGANWIVTRYVPWTSWFAGKSVWSSASGVTAQEGDGTGLAPGTYFRISIQGESDGMATFAHEFGHIKSIADNYNNPFGIPDGRSYTGVWELMSRGSFAGPYGTHNRWQVPSWKGSSAPAQHTARLKLKQDFYAEDQYTQIKEESLIANGPVFETIVARNIPTGSAIASVGYGVNSLLIELDSDNTPVVTKSMDQYNWQTSTWGSYNQNNPYYGKGYYQFYGLEVVQRVGYDSFACDEGVLITMNRATANLSYKSDIDYVENESAPWTWIIDSHPNDINLKDYTAPDGSDFRVSLGDARQLADGLFHAGGTKTALPGTGVNQDIGVNDVVSEYIDTFNNLHFYILDKAVDAQGALSYRVAVHSTEFTGEYSDQMSVSLGDVSPAKPGKIAVQEVKITNNGTKTGLYRLASSNVRRWQSKLDNVLVEVAPGETVTVPLYMAVPQYGAKANDFTFTATSEISDNSATLEGTLEPASYGTLTYKKDYERYTTSVNPGYEGKTLAEFPEELDPQSWSTNPQFTWDDLKLEHPYIDWMDDANLADDVNVMRGLVILVDFEDQPMFVGMEPGSDFMGNPVDANHPGHDFMGNKVPTEDITLPMPRGDMASFYKALLNEGTYLHGLSINRFWRENSYGHWAIELEVVGPYTLPGMEWEYGVNSMQNIKAEDGLSSKPGYTVNSTPKAIIADSVRLFLADQLNKPENERENLTHYNFGFILHAGYDESGLWQEASEMLYQTKDDIPETAGPTFEELESIKAWGARPQGLAEPRLSPRGVILNDIHWAEQMFAGISSTGEYIIDYTDANNNGYPDKGEKWAGTRYVEFTCWKAAKTVWSHATSYTAVAGDGSGLQPGSRWRISCQGESDGMGTFAHEFGHIRNINDNYNNQFQLNPLVRTYVGNWELMGAGDKSGPYGTHSRWIMPSTCGDVAPSNHVVRLKIKQGFYDEDQVTRVPEEHLINNGPVFETIVARNTPAGNTNKQAVGYGVNGLVIDLDKDNAPVRATNDPNYFWSDIATFGSMRVAKYADVGYYQFYSVEVIQKVGCESFMTDEGVLIALNREVDNENAPWTWIIDSHPAPIPVVDFYRPNGEAQMMLPGKNDQLADALFHLGAGEIAQPTQGSTEGAADSDQVVSEYLDTWNNLHFYVLDKMYDSNGVLSYRVAVRSEEFNGSYSDQMSVSLGANSPAKSGKVMAQEIIITNNGTQPGLYRLTEENDGGWNTMFPTNVIEVAPGETVSVPLYMQVPSLRPKTNDFKVTVTSEVSGKSASATGTVKPDVTAAGIGAHDTTRPGAGNVGTPTPPSPELPFIDVKVGDWFYNDVLVAYKDGLINGRTVTTYVPEGNITVAEAIKLAACMNQLHTDGKVTLGNGTNAWYSTYVDYCVSKGIIKAGEYTDMNAIATRAQFAMIFAAALPDEALPAINNIADGKIPDVKMADAYGPAVYKLYNAGVLIGNDAVGTFAPLTNIKRSEVATILNRMMHKENRKKLDL